MIPNYDNSPRSLHQGLGGVGQQSIQKVENPPAIPQVLDVQSKNLFNLIELISVLEGRLQPVSKMEPAQPTAGKDCEAMPPVQTVLERLNESNRLITRCCYRVQELTRLLEV